MEREELIATVTRITELRAEVARLGALQKELRQLEAMLDSMSGVTPAPVRTRQRSSQSIEDRLGELIESRVDREWTAEELAAEAEVKLPTVRASLSKLRKAGRIKDVRKGYVKAAKNGPEDLAEGEPGGSLSRVA
jgi:predicted Rossmann fold nucleotide-binding protein DprA/Smf involved in DNA uptake